MNTDTLYSLKQISKNEKMFNGLYRAASTAFDLPDGAMWILYFLIFSEEDVTQQEVADRMMLPKQTINSATAALTEKGLITLEKVPGSKRKKISLTTDGKALTDKTVKRLLGAECRAVERMGAEKIATYISLYGEFYACMEQEFREEGILDAGS